MNTFVKKDRKEQLQNLELSKALGKEGLNCCSRAANSGEQIAAVLHAS